MFIRLLHIAFLMVFSLAPCDSHADIYKWVDESGVENFADSEWKVPEKHRSKTTVIRERKAIAPPDAPAEAQPPAVAIEGKQEEIKETIEEKPATKGPLDSHGHDEAWWRARVDVLKKKKGQLERELAVVEKKLGMYTNRALILSQGQPVERQQDQVELAVRRDEIQRELAEIDYQINVELPDEARKAGALPGWLR